ncbi:hypothetical protein ACWEP4_06875 [Streptomyces sp. NPDC004227]
MVKFSDLLIFLGVLAVAVALSLLLGGGIASQVVSTLITSGGGVFVGTRIKERRNSKKVTVGR